MCAWNMISFSDATHAKKKLCVPSTSYVYVSWNLIWQICLFCTLCDYIYLHELMELLFLGYITTIVAAENPCTKKRTYALPFS